MTASDSLQLDALFQEARQQSGLDDFGADDFMPGLRMLLDNLHEARLNAAGLDGVRQSIVGSLLRRAQFQDWLRRHPEILDEELEPPIVISGMFRTGTTKLHRCLARDPNLRFIPTWLGIMPMPLPDSSPGRPDPRIAMVETMLEAMRQERPESYVIAHPMAAQEPEEEIFFIGDCFRSIQPK